MNKFAYAEEYILYIGGYINQTGNRTSWMLRSPPPVTLANYDKNVVESLCSQIDSNKGFTDRQAKLVEKLIKTYERQLRKSGIEQPDQIAYKLPLRTVDRSTTLTRNGDMLEIRFPYDENRINSIKTFAKDAHGLVSWDPAGHAWKAAITEFNVNWLVTFAKAHKLTISPEVNHLYELILEVEKTPFAIELRMGDDGKPYIENAPESMREYVDRHIGYSDIYALVDSAGSLGYTVSPEIAEAVLADQSEAFLEFCQKRVIDLAPTSTKYTITDVIAWAKEVNRLPVVVYNPNFLNLVLDPYAKFFDRSEILVIDRNTTEPVTVDPSIKIVYTNKVIPGWTSRMPLLISYANLMHSEQKKEFMNKAEKIVYLCEALPKR